jgi:hypothetical protein
VRPGEDVELLGLSGREVSRCKVGDRDVSRLASDTGEGDEADESVIESDFALRAHLLIPKGNCILGRCYNNWVRSVPHGPKSLVPVVDKCVKEEQQIHARFSAC